ncbi:MAG TPA: PEGA domain-containing protein, partial [Polyangiaceae bacterium]|nr:PEGA domain-containing protein [Polyangiaceae bacterium]
MYKFSTLPMTCALPFAKFSVMLALVVAPGMALAADPPTTPQASPSSTVKAEAKTTAGASKAPTAKAEAKTAASASAPAQSTTSTAAPTSQSPAPAQESSAQAQGPTPEQREEARLAFEAGTKSYADGQYQAALASFQKAYAIIPSPHAEYWIAMSMDKADPETKDPKSLAAAYETFLSNPGAGHVGAPQVEAAQARLSELRKGLPATITIVSTPAGASVTINGEPKDGVTPLSVEVPAGVYQVGLSLEGYDAATVEVSADGGVSLEQQVTLAQSVVAPPPEPLATTQAQEEPHKKSMVPAIVTLSLGGIGLISGTIFGILALDAKGKFNDDPTTEHADAAERNALIADMSFGIALTLGLTGIVLLTSDDSSATPSAKSKPSTQFAFAPYASPFGGGAAARMTF